jgi:hypothetical protein
VVHGKAEAGPGTLRRRIARLSRGVLAFGLLACGGEPPVLEVGPVGYTEEELGGLADAQRELLVDITAFGLVVADGRVDSLIAPHVRRDLRSIVLQRLAMELAATETGVGEAQLRRAYDGDPRYELVVRHLVILSERWRPAEHRDSSRARAREALERAREGESFEALAGEYSDEPGAAERGGLLEPGREGSWVPEFWRAASSLEEGQISPVVETEYGFHVIRLEDRRRIPFEEVRDEVLEGVMDLPTSLGRASGWAGRHMAVAEVDTGAVRSWREGDEVRPLVRWPDSLGVPALTGAWVTDYRETLLPGQLTALDSGGFPGAVDFVTSSARTYLMLDRAERLGIGPTTAQRAAIRERWTRRVAEWATALGFATGQSHGMVREEALQALGATEQSAAIARSEMEDLTLTLRALYPIRRPTDPAAGD